MTHKIAWLILIFSVFGWFTFLFLAPEVEATPTDTLPATQFIEKINQTGGQVRTVLKSGDTIIVAHRNVTNLYDGSDLSHPTLITAIEGFTALALAGNYLYGPVEESDTAWAVWDISQPLTPVQAGTFQVVGDFLGNTEAYLVFNETREFESGIAIYGLGTPTMPQVVGRLDDLYVKWAELAEDYLYVGVYEIFCDHGVCNEHYRQLTIIDLSEPTTPTIVGYGTGLMSNRWFSTISDGYLYQRSSVVGESDAVVISQISQDPAGVTEVATIDLADFYPSGITVHAGTLYLTNGFTTKIYDVTNPATPVLLSTVPEAYVGVVYEDYLFRMWDSDPLDTLVRYVSIFDLTTPTTPAAVTTIFHAAGDWAQKGQNNLLYIADTHTGYSSSTYLHTVDISTPDAPLLLRTDALQPNPNRSAPYEFNIVKDDYLYVARFAHEGTKDGVDIYRLPTATTPLTYIRTLQIDLRHTAVVDNAFLVQRGYIERELDIYDTSNPENPFRIAQLTIDHNGFVAMFTEGNYAYVVEGGEGNGQNRLFILDITVPGIPVVVGNADGDLSGGNVPYWAIANGYIYYSHTDGLGVMDVRNPATPTVTVLPRGIIPFEMATYWTDGQRLYLADGTCPTTIYVYTLENPAVPRFSSIKTLEDCSNTRQALVPNGAFFHIATDDYGVRTYGFIEGVAQFLPIVHRSP